MDETMEHRMDAVERALSALEAHVYSKSKNPRENIDVLETILKRIQERAQRVLEGEDWDLAGYCEEVISGLKL